MGTHPYLTLGKSLLNLFSIVSIEYTWPTSSSWFSVFSSQYALIALGPVLLISLV